jgi:hypothetical protein
MTFSRLSLALSTGLCALTLAACGGGDEEESGGDTVGSAEYIKQCEEQIGKQQSGRLDEEQVAEICKCTQDQLAEKGHADKKLTDTTLREDAVDAGRDCALEVVGQQ